MPPMLSDDEGSDPGLKTSILPKRTKKAYEDLEDSAESGSKFDANGDADEDNVDEAGEEAEDDEDDEDLDEDEYVVEKILSHIIEDGEPKFEVKWEGFEKKADRTWEPEENLKDTAAEILSEYLAGIGGREKLFEETRTALKTKKRTRASAGTPSGGMKRSRKNGDHPADSEAPASLQKEFRPPAGSWEEHVDAVDMCREDDGELAVYLTWKSGQKTRHPTKQAYQRCPQKILQFYESKINFRTD